MLGAIRRLGFAGQNESRSFRARTLSFEGNTAGEKMRPWRRGSSSLVSGWPGKSVSLSFRSSVVQSEETDEASKPADSPSAEAAFEEHFAMVWRGLRRLGVVEGALDDATQDVFLVLHRRWNDFQGQSSLKTWIYGIVMRVASDHTRRARRDSSRYSQVELDLASTLATPDQVYQRREAGRLLHRSLERLAETERQILVLVDLEEQSVIDAAEAIGIKLNTAYTRLRRARKSFEKAVLSERDKAAEGAHQ